MLQLISDGLIRANICGRSISSPPRIDIRYSLVYAISMCIGFRLEDGSLFSARSRGKSPFLATLGMRSFERAAEFVEFII